MDITYKYKFRLDILGSAIVRTLSYIAKAAGLNLANMFFTLLRGKNQFWVPPTTKIVYQIENMYILKTVCQFSNVWEALQIYSI